MKKNSFSIKMKTKILFLPLHTAFFALLFSALFFSGCGKNDQKNIPPPPEPTDLPVALQILPVPPAPTELAFLENGKMNINSAGEMQINAVPIEATAETQPKRTTCTGHGKKRPEIPTIPTGYKQIKEGRGCRECPNDSSNWCNLKDDQYATWIRWETGDHNNYCEERWHYWNKNSGKGGDVSGALCNDGRWDYDWVIIGPEVDATTATPLTITTQPSTIPKNKATQVTVTITNYDNAISQHKDINIAWVCRIQVNEPYWTQFPGGASTRNGTITITIPAQKEAGVVQFPVNCGTLTDYNTAPMLVKGVASITVKDPQKQLNSDDVSITGVTITTSDGTEVQPKQLQKGTTYNVKVLGRDDQQKVQSISLSLVKKGESTNILSEKKSLNVFDGFIENTNAAGDYELLVKFFQTTTATTPLAEKRIPITIIGDTTNTTTTPGVRVLTIESNGIRQDFTENKNITLDPNKKYTASANATDSDYEINFRFSKMIGKHNSGSALNQVNSIQFGKGTSGNEMTDGTTYYLTATVVKKNGSSSALSANIMNINAEAPQTLTLTITAKNGTDDLGGNTGTGTHTLTVEVEGKGDVVSTKGYDPSSPYIDCPEDYCFADSQDLTNFSLKADPDAGWRLKSWSADCTNGKVDISTASKKCTVTFESTAGTKNNSDTNTFAFLNTITPTKGEVITIPAESTTKSVEIVAATNGNNIRCALLKDSTIFIPETSNDWGKEDTTWTITKELEKGEYTVACKEVGKNNEKSYSFTVKAEAPTLTEERAGSIEKATEQCTDDETAIPVQLDVDCTGGQSLATKIFSNAGDTGKYSVYGLVELTGTEQVGEDFLLGVNDQPAYTWNTDVPSLGQTGTYHLLIGNNIPLLKGENAVYLKHARDCSGGSPASVHIKTLCIKKTGSVKSGEIDEEAITGVQNNVQMLTQVFENELKTNPSFGKNVEVEIASIDVAAMRVTLLVTDISGKKKEYNIEAKISVSPVNNTQSMRTNATGSTVSFTLPKIEHVAGNTYSLEIEAYDSNGNSVTGGQVLSIPFIPQVASLGNGDTGNEGAGENDTEDGNEGVGENGGEGAGENDTEDGNEGVGENGGEGGGAETYIPKQGVNEETQQKMQNDGFTEIHGVNNAFDFAPILQELENIHVTLRKLFEFNFLPSLGKLTNAVNGDTIRFSVGDGESNTLAWHNIYVLDFRDITDIKWTELELNNGEKMQFLNTDGTPNTTATGWIKKIGALDIPKQDIPCDANQKYCPWIGWTWTWSNTDKKYYHASGECAYTPETGENGCTKWPVQFLDMTQL